MVEVKSSLVQDSKLLKSRPLLARPYVFPFIPLYAFFYRIYTQLYDEYIGGQEWTFVYLGSIISLNLLFWLMPAWNTSINLLFNYSKVSSLEEAEFVYVKTTPNNGSDDIVKIESAFEQNTVQIFFQFQKKRFLLDDAKQTFASPKFSIDEPLKLEFFQKNKGNSGDLTHARRLYGENTFDIPIPTFLELYKEHAIAPFFVFQVFCVALWFLDEMWYYSLFNLFMILMMEAATVFQRLNTLKEFRTMGIKPFPINVYRDGKWTLLQTNELLPNDLVSVVRSNDETAVPCDLVLVDGSCIVNEAMLSGESTPLLKESIKLRPQNEFIDLEGVDKNSILHGGTKCLQITKPDSPIVKQAPDDGALAIVTKTGFETSQGSLVRVMLFSAEQVSANNKEAFAFIGFLLIFAIAASWYVWVEGTKMGRVHSKLILDCVLIITSVVPPELPMELTMAVNASLAALSKFYVYCTEPFRIPLAGRVDVCCFDKTGTLTGEDLVFEGVAGLKSEDGNELIQPDASCEDTSFAIGSCHALVKLDDGEIVGDPMEKATLKACGWTVESETKVSHQELGTAKVLRRFQFSSALKRSATVSSYKNKVCVSVKGAPEVLRERLSSIPSNYDDIYKHYTRNGSRVLAIAVKTLDSNIKIDKLIRQEVESGLKFVGFLVYHCPLKDDAVETIKMLNESSHRSIMITGDNPLTAVHVAKQVAIVERDVLIIDKPSESHEIDYSADDLIIRNVEETFIKKFTPSVDEFEGIFGKYDLAVTGYALNLLFGHKQIKELLKHTWVYARVSPTQKEYILNELKDMGYQTLMCGDGTNDVGALKQAHVGIALLNGTEEGLKKIAEQRKIDGMKQMYDKQCDMFNRWGKPAPPVPEPIAHLFPPSQLNPHYLKALEKQGTEITPEMRKEVDKAMKQPLKAKENKPLRPEDIKSGDMSDLFMNALNGAGGDDDEDSPVLKLGDASCAAPFTSKLSKVSAVTNIIRQGRCALINTIQMYKILALNCLISAYSLSIMFIMGVKFGDAQATVSGLLLSACFLSISRGKPIEKLSKERPQAGIFNVYIMGSILSQFAVHCISLLYLTNEIYKLEPREPVLDLDKTFEPSLLNTGIFLIQLIQQVSTFYVNYQGEPFRENIRNNKGMYYGIVGVFALAFAGATELIPELNEAIKFVPMEDSFKGKLTGALLLDFFGAWAGEQFFKFFFMDDKPSDIAHK